MSFPALEKPVPGLSNREQDGPFDVAADQPTWSTAANAYAASSSRNFDRLDRLGASGSWNKEGKMA
jgi:hypothetical protein